MVVSSAGFAYRKFGKELRLWNVSSVQFKSPFSKGGLRGIIVRIFSLPIFASPPRYILKSASWQCWIPCRLGWINEIRFTRCKSDYFTWLSMDRWIPYPNSWFRYFTAFSSEKSWLLDYLHHGNLLLYTLLIKEIENPKTEDWELKTGIQWLL